MIATLKFSAVALPFLLLSSAQGAVTSASYQDGNGTPDVGTAPGSSAAIISGWDFDSISFSYNSSTDILAVNLDFFGIAGDADGDGNPGAITLGNGNDLADLSGSESITVGFDFENDMDLDIVVGIPAGDGSGGADDTGITGSLALLVADHDAAGGSILGQQFGAANTTGTAFLEANPSAISPDFNFAITNWSDFTDTPNTFGFDVFTGSFADAGIGEDFFAPSVTATLVPEPSTALLALSGILLLARRKR